jgi:hypothetical protein
MIHHWNHWNLHDPYASVGEQMVRAKMGGAGDVRGNSEAWKIKSKEK